MWAFSVHLLSVLLLLLLLDNAEQPFEGVSGLVVLLLGYGVLFGASALHNRWQSMLRGLR